MSTTTWRAEWSGISARIEGLVRAGEFYYLSIQKDGQDSYGASKNILLPESEEIYCCLDLYLKEHGSALPQPAAERLKVFVEKHKDQFTNKVESAMRMASLQMRLTALSAFRSEYEFWLVGAQEQIRTTTERAFLHLQRCIVADDGYRRSWNTAYDKGETQCERLGAVHLLWHGIWAFKVNSVGARTDLVMGDQIDNPSQVEKTALGMVLTEWKKAEQSEVEARYREGRIQATHYAAGTLAGVELSDTRYVVVLTKKCADGPADVIENDITYRFVNIAVDPDVPSRAARNG